MQCRGENEGKGSVTCEASGEDGRGDDADRREKG